MTGRRADAREGLFWFAFGRISVQLERQLGSATQRKLRLRMAPDTWKRVDIVTVENCTGWMTEGMDDREQRAEGTHRLMATRMRAPMTIDAHVL